MLQPCPVPQPCPNITPNHSSFRPNYASVDYQITWYTYGNVHRGEFQIVYIVILQIIILEAFCSWKSPREEKLGEAEYLYFRSIEYDR